jgi:general secretion pathway protein G
MLRRPRHSRGFTLIELIVVIAIISIIAAILIPALLDAIQRAKQKRTVADVRSIGLAWFSWVTDHAGAPAAGRAGSTFDFAEYTTVTYDQLVDYLTPVYLTKLPSLDGWGNPMEFARSTSLDVLLPIAIRSPGRDGVFEAGGYSNDPFMGTDYNRDIVWVGGFFFQWPSTTFNRANE